MNLNLIRPLPARQSHDSRSRPPGASSASDRLTLPGLETAARPAADRLPCVVGHLRTVSVPLSVDPQWCSVSGPPRLTFLPVSWR